MKTNERLITLLQATVTCEHDTAVACEKGTVVNTPVFSTVLKQIIVNAEKNAGKYNTQRRHPDVLKKFSMALFIYAGPMAFEFIHQNMPEALPSLRTVQSLVHA